MNVTASFAIDGVRRASDGYVAAFRLRGLLGDFLNRRSHVRVMPGSPSFTVV
jgi:hypothetical protein